jgi:glycine cleavage system regulatory protein
MSHALAGLGVSIDQLETATANAPMAGGMLFEAHASLQVPLDLEDDLLRSTLEELANELMVDIDLDDEPAAG